MRPDYSGTLGAEALTYGIYAMQAAQGLVVLTALADGVRFVYNSVEAKSVTADAGMDIGADFGELGICLSKIANHGTNTRGMGANGAYWCFALMYGTLGLVTALEALNGWGPPDKGGEFAAGQSKLGDVNYILTGAAPSYGAWSGSAAYAHGELNQQIFALLDVMQTADRQTAAITQRQAEDVQRAREEFAATRLALVGLILLVMAVLAASGAYTVAASAAIVEALTGFQPDNVGGEAIDRNADSFSKAQSGAKGGYRFQGLAESVQGFIETWLPAIVLPPCIGALAAVGCFLDRLIEAGNSNANDVNEQTTVYQSVLAGATRISADPAPNTVRMPAAPAPSSPVLSASPVRVGMLQAGGRMSTVARAWADPDAEIGAATDHEPAVNAMSERPRRGVVGGRDRVLAAARARVNVESDRAEPIAAVAKRRPGGVLGDEDWRLVPEGRIAPGEPADHPADRSLAGGDGTDVITVAGSGSGRR